jgi:transposase InsO family protein
MVKDACDLRQPVVRLAKLLGHLGVACSSWYAKPAADPRRPGRKPKGVPEALAGRIRLLAESYPWWGYKRIAVVARRQGLQVSNKQVYRVFKVFGLLQKKRVREAALYQAARLCELLPSAPNELWQSDVTYIHIPGHGWWYAVTVIDY